MNHCCLGMQGVLEAYGTPVKYIPYKRRYIIQYNSTFQNKETGEDAIGVATRLKFCPWCGNQLPKDLANKWVEEIETKFNVTETLDRDQLNKIPQEYMTDEWWKKRGL